MLRPKIVIFWGKPVGPLEGKTPHPYGRIGVKKPVYDQLLVELEKSAEVYVAVGYENYPRPLYFTEAYRFLGPDKFIIEDNGVQADAVYDRSAKMSFPGNSDLENQKILNASSFKNFSNNKWALYQMFPSYCPKTWFADKLDDYLKILAVINPKKQYVVKPYNGYKGKGIAFGTPDELKKYPFETPVIVQDFKETKAGIPGLVIGRHDLRVAVVDGDIVWATIRQPQGDNLLANVAQGGSIAEIKISEVPESVLPIVKKLAEKFKQDYFNPLFSIDFGFENGRPFIYEINDQIGFPRPEMKNNLLVKSLAKVLIEKAKQ